MQYSFAAGCQPQPGDHWGKQDDGNIEWRRCHGIGVPIPDGSDLHGKEGDLQRCGGLLGRRGWRCRVNGRHRWVNK
jgi:hypothetical protein